MSRGSIEVERLVRTYRRPDRGPGVRGALKQLVKPSWETVEGLRGIDLSVRPGETVGYVGLNGSGKSTTIKLLSGVMRPTSGLVRVNGLDPVAQRARNARHIAVVSGSAHAAVVGSSAAGVVRGAAVRLRCGESPA